MGRRPKQIFLQRRYMEDQQAHEKMFNTVNYQRNADQNYNEVSLHIVSEWPSSKSLQVMNGGGGTG